MNFLKHVGILLVFAFSATAAYALDPQFTYQGRIMKPNGEPLEGGSVQFRIQVRTPNSSSCLMYEELKSISMTGSKGTFSFTINDGTGSRQDSSGLDLEEVFSNRIAFNFSPSDCSGSTYTYTPALDSGRTFRVLFNDGSGWSQVPDMNMAKAPYAIESMQVGGFKADNLVRVVNGSGVPQSLSPMTLTQHTELMALIGGTSTQYAKTNQFMGVNLPAGTMAHGYALRMSSSGAWEAYDPGAGGGGSGTVTSVVAGTGLTGGNIIAAGTISLASVGTAGVGYKISYDEYGRVTASAGITEADLPTITSAGKVSGDAITSGTIGGTTSISTSGTVAASQVSTRGLHLSNMEPKTISIVPPASIAATGYTLTLPVDAGTTGQVLTTNGTGGLSWSSPLAGTAGGDLTGNYPNPTVAAIRGVAVNVAAPTAAGQVLRYNSTPEYAPAFLSLADIRSTIGPGFTQTFPSTSCTTKQTLTWSSITDTLVCSDISITAGDVAGTVVNGGQAGAVTVGTDDLNTLTLETNNTARLTIGTTGNVGIGTTTPAYALEVQGTIRGRQALTIGGNDSTPYLSDAGSASSPGSGGVAKITIANPIVGDNMGTYLVFNTINTASTNSFSYIGSVAATGGVNTAPIVFGQRTGGTAYSERMRIDSAGNVGIGTTTPAYPLDVSGAGRFSGILRTGSTGSAGSLVFSRSSDGATAGTITTYSNELQFGSPQNNGFHSFFAADSGGVNAERMRITGSGNVGIGTTSPSAPLHIYSTATSTDRGIAMDYNAADANGAVLRMRKGHAGPVQSGDELSRITSAGYDGASYIEASRISSYVESAPSTNIVPTYLSFYTMNTGGTLAEKVRINSAGNVGIGTGSPARLLHVAGPMRMTASAVPASPAAGDIYVDSTDSNKLKWHDGTSWQTVGSSSGTSQWTTVASGIHYSSGSVGIGISSPTVALDVAGGVKSSAGFFSGNASMYLHDSTTASIGGNVGASGVGGILMNSGYGYHFSSTNNGYAAQDLSIMRDAAGILAQRRGTNSQALRVYNTYTDASNYERAAIDWQTSANVLRVGTEAAGTGSVRNIALMGGSVGIGTTTPNERLYVIGNIGANGDMTAGGTIRASAAGGYSTSSDWMAGITFPNAAGNNTADIALRTSNTTRLTVTSGGSVGIGTAAPARLFHVAGPMRMTASAAPSSPAAGDIFIDSSDLNKLKWHNGTGWQTVSSGAGTPGGSDTQIQFNNAGAFGGNAGFVWDNTNGRLGVNAAAPKNALEVQAPTEWDKDNTYSIAAVDSSTGNRKVVMGFDSNADTGVIQSIYTGSGPRNLTLQPNGGFVGIGVNVPRSHLHLASGAAVSVLTQFTNSTTGHTAGDGTQIGIDGGGNFGIHNIESAYTYFTTGGTERMRITSGGSVGIGTTNPSYTLDVNSGSVNTAAQFTVASNTNNLRDNLLIRTNHSGPSGAAGLGAGIYFLAENSAGSGAGIARIGSALSDATSGAENSYLAFSTARSGAVTEALRIMSDGKIGVNTTSPSALLANTSSGIGDASTSYQAPGGLAWSANGAGYAAGIINTSAVANAHGLAVNVSSTGTNKILNLRSGGGDVMTVFANGTVGIGTASPGEKLEVAGSVKAVSFVTGSDRRLKTDIEPVEGWEAISRLEGTRYRLKSTGTTELGLIAQDVEKVFPEAVVTDRQSGLKGVKYQSLIAPLIEAVKENRWMCEASHAQMQKEISDLKKENEDIRKELNEIRTLLRQVASEKGP